ncbi:MBL fold metallo-hydrolase [Oceanobacillus sp. 143]|uniref:MBL fold metallo-hydrolase n=1 Tax=Oceanobacillus zhaokaii TaxID=2052660 RepID=A0A345PJM4_9BACI|nr:MBL fold metallo-hydrolase [Oceanobacillus zhaokaii]AXI10204.1 MBL fold metallo-hydrolase [Oceanobacillus zhaokaii]QGS69301.1 MBL fold metallo-hydrolase [Oceanobacillus sp. 143]
MLEQFGINSIKLDLPFRLNHVNSFIAEGTDGWTVIDAGLHNVETVKRWEQELDGKTVTNILVTHYHPDHFGYVGGLQQKTGASVSMSMVDADAGLNAWEDLYLDKLTDNYLLAGIPDDIANQMSSNTEEFISLVTPYPKINHYFQEGELIPFGMYEYEVIFTPGHSDGLITLYNKEKSMLLATDHILPNITPNISYWFHGDPNPLKTFLNSLAKIKKLDVDFVVPSHGQPFYGANDRIDEIIAHHDERLTHSLEIIADGCTVYEVCQELFPKIKNTHDKRFAIGETIAHLEYLYVKNECVREVKDGKYIYYI